MFQKEGLFQKKPSILSNVLNILSMSHEALLLLGSTLLQQVVVHPPKKFIAKNIRNLDQREEYKYKKNCHTHEM
jgi:hypothetical protein